MKNTNQPSTVDCPDGEAGRLKDVVDRVLQSTPRQDLAEPEEFRALLNRWPDYRRPAPSVKDSTELQSDS